MDENEPRVNKRKITKEREEAYENAQRLGNALTMRGLSEFQDQCIGSTTKEEAATQVSTTTRDEATQASITIQYIDREKARDFCEIGMGFLIDDDNYKNKEAMKEYKGNVEDQNKFASFDSFPGVAEFIRDVLSTDKEDFIKTLRNHEKRLKATGTIRTFMNIVCYTFTDFSSNCKQELPNSNNHERTPFVK
ncbi:hypothetical protein G6F56_002192 [Rhizopus delemar]|nr:hypothetical protein G6F56_002192 [Rhizopus delemar]